jgi:hypothetical protein
MDTPGNTPLVEKLGFNLDGLVFLPAQFLRLFNLSEAEQ